MTRIAYFDCAAGAAGDMILAALIDAGARLEDVEAGLATILEIQGEWGLESKRVWKGRGQIAATKINVSSTHMHEPVPPPAHDEDGVEPHPEVGNELHHNHDHDHGHHHHHHHHDHSHDHAHDHSHALDASENEQEFEHSRNLSDICRMLDQSKLSSWVKDKSKLVFTCLAEAEARAHGSTIDKVHFHEVGVIDSIIDTVGSILALELLHVDEVYCSPMPYSNGFVNCMHGTMPVPVPATLDLMTGVPVMPPPRGATGELVTPTGMSILKALAKSFGPPPPFIPSTHGSGAGTKEFPGHANIVRVVIGDLSAKANERPTDSTEETVVVLETNLDDMNPQILSHVQELLFDEGALDVWWQPIQMKKSRPALLLSVLCEPSKVSDLSNILFCETTTLGIRRRTMERTILERKFTSISSSYGQASVKIGYLDGKVVNVQPEYEDCKKLALAANVPLKTVLAEIQALAREQLSST